MRRHRGAIATTPRRRRDVRRDRPPRRRYGGVITLTIAVIVLPFIVYSGLVATGMDSNQVGVALSGVFVIGGVILWTLSYVFRVFSKDMTYSTQLKQYEDAVIQKRFEELQDDEVEALLGEIERESSL